jgi:hypothetical protein
MDIRDLSTRQIANALIIFAAALPFGGDAAKAALMTAAAESSFMRYANNGDSQRPEVWKAYGGQKNFRDVIRQSLTFPHDAEAGAAWTTADSLGLFQQRIMYDYGSVKDLMDPAESTRIFVRGSAGGSTRYFLESPKNMSLAQRCQWTQGSEFPTGENYAPMETVADQLIAHFGGLPPQVKDWFVANNWDEAKAELDKTLRPLMNNVQALYDDNKLDGFPYGKQAAGFNDLRALSDRVQWLVDNETIPVDPSDASKGNYPFTKTAASFNDLRALQEQVKELTDLVKQLLAK